MPAPNDLLNSQAPLRMPGAAVPVGKNEPIPVGSSSKTERSRLNFTAFASSSVPSWNLIPLRSLKTQRRPPSFTSQPVASHGIGCVPGPSYHTSRS